MPFLGLRGLLDSIPKLFHHIWAGRAAAAAAIDANFNVASPFWPIFADRKQDCRCFTVIWCIPHLNRGIGGIVVVVRPFYMVLVMFREIGGIVVVVWFFYVVLVVYWLAFRP